MIYRQAGREGCEKGRGNERGARETAGVDLSHYCCNLCLHKIQLQTIDSPTHVWLDSARKMIVLTWSCPFKWTVLAQCRHLLTLALGHTLLIVQLWKTC